MFFIEIIKIKYVKNYCEKIVFIIIENKIDFIFDNFY